MCVQCIWRVTPAKDQTFMLGMVEEASHHFDQAFATRSRGIPDTWDTAPGTLV